MKRARSQATKSGVKPRRIRPVNKTLICAAVKAWAWPPRPAGQWDMIARIFIVGYAILKVDHDTIPKL